ncbi:hypothetical protein [Intrasporangium calvum]|uniref:hypothetical protein n=1 Tax=Intrasporangium calvum TaxID=53358 RepID=UPI0012374E50|nr:hypothetical protein [Intrasporangium calvum]
MMEGATFVDELERSQLRADLTFSDSNSQGRDADLVRRWIRDFVDSIADDYVARLAEAPIPAYKHLERRSEPFGTPGQTWGHLRIARGKPSAPTVELMPWSEKALDAAMLRVEDPQHVELSIMFCVLNEWGYPGMPVLHGGFDSLPWGDGARSLFVDARQRPGGPAPYRLAVGTLKDIVRSALEYSEPNWGAIALDSRGLTTPFEECAGLAAGERLRGGFARGYSWITILDRDKLQRAGGLSQMDTSGAFFNVERLPGGGAWLQATEQPGLYRDENWLRVHRALRGVLPVPEIWAIKAPGFPLSFQLAKELGD